MTLTFDKTIIFNPDINYQWLKEFFFAKNQVGHIEELYSCNSLIKCERKGMQFDVPKDIYEFDTDS